MKRMKKLLLLLAVLALILGATFAATKLDPEYEAEEDTSAVIFTVDADSVTNLGWDYSEKISFTRSEDSWICDQDAAFPVDTDYLDTMLETLAEIRSSRTIENVEDWDQYGLEIPVCTVTVTTDTTTTLSIGLETSIGGERYFSIGDGNAYLVADSIINAFSYGLYDVLEYETIPNITGVTGMELTTDAQSYAITLQENSGLAYSDDYVWFMDGKVLDTDLTEDLITNVVDLMWGECVNYNAEDLSAYGLDTPKGIVTVNYTETVSVSTGETDEEGNAVFETRKDPMSFTLEIGSDSGNGHYARIAGSNMVYRINSTTANTLLYTTYYELQPDEVLLMDWEDVTSVDITLDGETYEIRKGTKEVTDEEGNTSEETVYTLNDAEVDFDDVLTALDGLSSTGYATGLTPERNEEIRFVIHREHETFPEVELAFYQYDSASCMTLLNGEATVFADREGVVALIEEVNSIVLG